MRRNSLIIRFEISMYLRARVLAGMEVLALRMAPAWLLNSYLDEGVLALWDLV